MGTHTGEEVVAARGMFLPNDFLNSEDRPHNPTWAVNPDVLEKP